MLTALGLLVALVAPAPAMTPAAPVITIQLSQDGQERLWRALALADLMPVLRDEAVDEAARLEGEGLIAGAGRPWGDVVATIHDPDRMGRLFRDGVAQGTGRADPQLIDRALRFHESELGRRIVDLEVSARRALAEPGIDDAARAAFAEAVAAGDPRAQRIRALIQEADLVAPNVAGGLNAALAFSRGYADGGGYDMAPDPQQMGRDAWVQRAQIEADATAWLEAFLLMAYAPLTDAELAAYRDHALSPEGRALSELLFAGFDRVFVQTSYDMGVAAALRGTGQAL
ncbi:hypothetical protein [Paracoccus sp. ME4]|uniref:hypothetical protein n=1 Tax=Paracoccus sp. ME4 TaxID=3138066 RepID=UPI00398B52EF